AQGRRLNGKHRNADASTKAKTPNGNALSTKAQRGYQHKSQNPQSNRERTQDQKRPRREGAKKTKRLRVKPNLNRQT
ncbi:hypothetical protein, partial [Paraburkholderia hospita]|uniref:hypothetical protein n=1 Tax=Paraburkholderia hospita TaxID=169430 RepID=UPI001A9930F5